jgi:hypothetical protein
MPTLVLCVVFHPVGSRSPTITNTVLTPWTWYDLYLSSLVSRRNHGHLTACESLADHIDFRLPHVGSHCPFDSTMVLVFCFICGVPAKLCVEFLPSAVPEFVAYHPSIFLMQQLQIHNHLYRGWVQHNSDRCAEGLWWEVVSELCAYYTGVAYCRQLVTFQLVWFDRCVPCGLVIFPQITRIFDPLTSLCAR